MYRALKDQHRHRPLDAAPRGRASATTEIRSKAKKTDMKRRIAFRPGSESYGFSFGLFGRIQPLISSGAAGVSAPVSARPWPNLRGHLPVLDGARGLAI